MIKWISFGFAVSEWRWVWVIVTEDHRYSYVVQRGYVSLCGYCSCATGDCQSRSVALASPIFDWTVA